MPEHIGRKTLDEVADTRKRDFQRLLLNWAKENLRDFPWRKNQTPYSILVTEVLLRRTTASAVLRIYPPFMKEYGNLNKLAAVSETQLESLLSSIGYHKERARILKNMAKFIVEKFNGVVPCSRDLLLEIPHVGSYTAGAVMSLGCGQPAAMVDTNVERVYGRIFLSHLPKKGQKRFINQLAAMYVPEDKHQVYNLTMLDLAALVCTYGIPRCGTCPVKGLCDYFSEELPRR